MCAPNQEPCAYYIYRIGAHHLGHLIAVLLGEGIVAREIP